MSYATEYRGDIVFLHDLRVRTVIGIFDWERRIQQTVSIDLEMAHDLRAAAASDDIEDCLDYKAAAKAVIALVEGSEFHLVEALADAIARKLVTDFSIPWVRVTLSKPGAVRGSRDVGVRRARRALTGTGMGSSSGRGAPSSGQLQVLEPSKAVIAWNASLASHTPSDMQLPNGPPASRL